MPCSVVSPSATTSFTPVVVPPANSTTPGVTSAADSPTIGGPPYSPPGSCDMPADGYDGAEVYAKQISKNFTLGQFSNKAVCTPKKVAISRCAGPPTAFTPQQIACNLSYLAKTLMDPISDKMKADGRTGFIITSGFRPGTGGDTSDHARGMACDFQPSGGWLESYRVTLIKWIMETLGTSVRQVIFEKSTPNGASGWIHVAVVVPGYPKLPGQILTCVDAAKYASATYTPGLPGQAGVPYTVRS